jgi:O-antigen/teichoic acid export membrane protein
MALSFVATTIAANEIGPEGYGDIKFVTTIWTILNTLITFGFLNSACRVLAVENEEKKMRQVFGAALILALVMGLAISLISLLVSLVVDPIFHVNLGGMVAFLSPLTITYPLLTAFTLMLQASNQIYLLVMLNLFPTFLYMMAYFVAAKYHLLTPTSALFLQQIATVPAFIILFVKVKPSFDNLKECLKVIWDQNKTYGFPAYLGSISAIVTGQVNRLSISYWTNTTMIGYYSLASSLTTPLTMLPNAVGTSSYRQFANQKRMDKKLLIATVATSLFAFAVVFIFCRGLISWVFKSGFSTVGPMTQVMSFGSILWGFGDFFNRFLGAHGKGRAMRNISLTNGVVNIFGILILTPHWGAWGAVATMILMATIYLGQELYYYKRMQVETN